MKNASYYNPGAGIYVEHENINTPEYDEIQVTIRDKDQNTLVEVQVTEDGRACSVKICDTRVSIHADELPIRLELMTQLNRLP